jgi:hypothetical protein
MGFPPPSVSDRTKPFPAPSSTGPEGPENFVRRVQPAVPQFPEADARSSETPGPIVEESDTFFR